MTSMPLSPFTKSWCSLCLWLCQSLCSLCLWFMPKLRILWHNHKHPTFAHTQTRVDDGQQNFTSVPSSNRVHRSKSKIHRSKSNLSMVHKYTDQKQPRMVHKYTDQKATSAWCTNTQSFR